MRRPNGGCRMTLTTTPTATVERAASTVFAPLRRKPFIALTTYRRDGSAVATPVWFALCGGALAVRTAAATGKVKRLRRDGRVMLAPCTFKGRSTGPAIAARARVLAVNAWPAGDAALARKYGLLRRLINLAARLRRIEHVLLVIEPAA